MKKVYHGIRNTSIDKQEKINVSEIEIIKPEEMLAFLQKVSGNPSH